MIWDVTNHTLLDLNGSTVLVLAAGTIRECHHVLSEVKHVSSSHDFLCETWGDGSITNTPVIVDGDGYRIGNKLYVSDGGTFAKGYRR